MGQPFHRVHNQEIYFLSFYCVLGTVIVCRDTETNDTVSSLSISFFAEGAR